jgi:excisionase family DNA binding protein
MSNDINARETRDAIGKYLPPRAHFTVIEISKVLGISSSSAYAMIARGVLPAVRIGGHLRIQRERLIEWYRDLPDKTIGGS